MTLLYFILFIGVLIFVHEMGHFLFAKLFDVKVLKFSLGFGPRAAGFRKGETEYCVAWVPLGGYVKMLGEDPTEEVKSEDQGRAFNQKALWKRYIIVLAGPAFNLIFPILIYFIFFVAQTTLPPSVIGKTFSGQPAAEAELQPGDRITAIDGRKVRYWQDLQSKIAESAGRRLRFTIERDGKQFDRFITPREQAIRNWLNLVQLEGRIGVSPLFEPAQIGVSDPGSPAARAGLRTGDLVTSVNGVAIERWPQLAELLRNNRGESLRISYLRPQAGVSQFIDLRPTVPAVTVLDPEPRVTNGVTTYGIGLYPAELFVREVEKGSPAEKMGLRPNDRVTEFNGKPVHSWDIILIALQERREQEHSLSWVPMGGKERSGKFRLAQVTFVDEYHHEQQRYVFGAQNHRILKSADPVPIEGRFTYAVAKSVSQTGEIIGMMTVAVVQIFRGAIPHDTIGGPLMLAYTARVAAEKGWDHFLRMLALISINLGILNLLPIPILDGGHILFFTIEAVKRRQLSLRVREVATYIGLVLLVSLMIFAFKNDIVRYWFK